jgi:hypothetical protein
MTGVCHHAQLLVEIGSHKLFASAGLKPQSSQEASITGMTHQHPASHVLCSNLSHVLTPVKPSMTSGGYLQNIPSLAPPQNPISPPPLRRKQVGSSGHWGKLIPACGREPG